MSGPYRRAYEGEIPQQITCGSDDEPWSTKWCEVLAQGFGPRWKEGVKILDYGCGYGRFCNYMTEWFQKFEYTGLEVPNNEHAERCIAFAKRYYGNRGQFNYLGGNVEAAALESVDVVLLGSVFTHFTFPRFIEVFKWFIPTIERGGAVVFTVIPGIEYTLGLNGALGLDGFYTYSRFTAKQMAEWWAGINRSFTLTKTGSFVTMYSFPDTIEKIVHDVYRVEKEP